MRNKLYLLICCFLVIATTAAPGTLLADEADILYKEGLALEKSGKRDFALFRYFTITRNYPNSKRADDALLKTGEFYYDNKDYFNAKETFEELIKKHPQSPHSIEANAYLEKIAVMSRKSDIESGIRHIISGMETLKREERLDDLEDECDKLSAFQPLSADYNAELIKYYKICANAYLENKILGKAKVVYEKLIKIAPDDTDALNALYEINRLLKPELN